jgi:transposase-like protein
MHKKTVHSALFKTEVATAAIKAELTQAQISSKYEIHSTQITNWKKQAVESIKQLFASKLPHDKKDSSEQKDQSKSYEEIGRLKVELHWLKKKSNFEL